jgi:hypothetical protein
MRFWRITVCMGPGRVSQPRELLIGFMQPTSWFLRIAVEGPEAVADARTESVAAPAVRAVGICVRQLVVFDDFRTVRSLSRRGPTRPHSKRCASMISSTNGVGYLYSP